MSRVEKLIVFILYEYIFKMLIIYYIKGKLKERKMKRRNFFLKNKYSERGILKIEIKCIVF